MKEVLIGVTIKLTWVSSGITPSDIYSATGNLTLSLFFAPVTFVAYDEGGNATKRPYASIPIIG